MLKPFPAAGNLCRYLLILFVCLYKGSSEKTSPLAFLKAAG